MKKFLSLILALTLLFPLSFSAKAEKDAIYDLVLDSQGAYVFNLETDTAIYEKAQDSRMFPASTTKIMTALVVLENCPDPKNTFITVEDTSLFRYIIEDGGVHMSLMNGETFTVYDLLLGLMINSFCDVAELLAYHFGNRNVENFIEMMNQRAHKIGLENTHFENAHGLHSTNHYSSPRDVALFMAEAIKNETFLEIISTRKYTIPATGQRGERQLNHTVNIYSEKNDYYLDAFVGGKSGFTDQAGRCLATYSTKDGISYVSVLLGANMDTNRNYSGNMSYIETHTLISYAYEHFQIQTVLEKGAQIGQIPVTDGEVSLPVLAGEEIRVLSRKGETPGYFVLLPEAILPDKVKDGAVVGEAKLMFNGEEAEGSYPLVLSWDGVPITTKSQIQKGAESAWGSVSKIFQTDETFLTLLILLIFIVALCIPAMKITRILHKKKSHRPKH